MAGRRDAVRSLYSLSYTAENAHLLMRNGQLSLYKKRLYRDLTSSRRPATAIQLYSAIHYTAIQRYTVYMLYIIPLERSLHRRISDARFFARKWHARRSQVKARCAAPPPGRQRHTACLGVNVSKPPPYCG